MDLLLLDGFESIGFESLDVFSIIDILVSFGRKFSSKLN